VDEAARLDTHVLDPHYPDSLFTARVPGKVVVEFVVDTAGNVVPATIDILASTHPLFARAVRSSLAVAHFTPAVAGGHKVPQYVQLPFTFAVSDSLSPH
jgi:TonB family protein